MAEAAICPGQPPIPIADRRCGQGPRYCGPTQCGHSGSHPGVRMAPSPVRSRATRPAQALSTLFGRPQPRTHGCGIMSWRAPSPGFESWDQCCRCSRCWAHARSSYLPCSSSRSHLRSRTVRSASADWLPSETPALRWQRRTLPRTAGEGASTQA